MSSSKISILVDRLLRMQRARVDPQRAVEAAEAVRRSRMRPSMLLQRRRTFPLVRCRSVSMVARRWGWPRHCRGNEPSKIQCQLRCKISQSSRLREISFVFQSAFCCMCTRARCFVQATACAYCLSSETVMLRHSEEALECHSPISA